MENSVPLIKLRIDSIKDTIDISFKLRHFQRSDFLKIPCIDITGHKQIYSIILVFLSILVHFEYLDRSV